MQTCYQRRFVNACGLFNIPCQPYRGPGVRTVNGLYVPDYVIETTNGLKCEIEADPVWSSAVTLREVCLVLRNFYVMTESNMALVESGRFAFTSLADAVERDRLAAILKRILDAVHDRQAVLAPDTDLVG